MGNQPFILDAWRFKNGFSEHILNTNQFEEGCWYHCQRDENGLSDWLASIGMEEALIDLLTDSDTRSHYQKLDGDNFLLILRGVNLNNGDAPDDMLSLRIIFYRQSLITLRRKPFKAIKKIQKSLEDQKLMPLSITELIVTVIEEINFRIEKVLDDVELIIDEIEDNIDRLSRTQQRQLTLIQRRLLRLNRFLKPQAAAINAFFQYVPSSFLVHSQRILNQKEIAFRINEHIDSSLQLVSVLRNDLQQSSADKMSRNSYYLSLIAGIFLPLSFFTGLFSINIGGMPGVDDLNAFKYFCMALLGIGLLGFLVLRRLRFW